ncbi:MAG: DUF1704 domain-containing protein [Candidatus Aenigmarchaeota archaeon]|nr:DUF1704 domain-containing protein [Candidatus Aenigmarchaeota archaeon]
MADIQALKLLDEALIDSAKKVKPLYYIEPVNEKEEKEEFLAGSIQNPRFSYRDLEYDPREIEQRLESIEIPDDELGTIFERKKRDILLENRIIANRGDEDIVREATIMIYGPPSEQLVEYADKLLRETPNIEAEKRVSSELIRNALQEALFENGLADWHVELSDKRLTTVYAAEKKITVCKERKFAEIDIERLKVHEVGVHALRAANGYEQPLKIFALGLPGYLSTEEGLALYFEEMTNNTSKEMMRDYAARVIAVDSVCQGLNFKQTFDRLKSYDLTNDQAWSLAVRAHRAGGYIKDHVYLDGYGKVKEFAVIDGDFDTLYVGRIGIEHLPLVRRLVKEGTLKKAKYKPHFIR